MVLWLCPGEHTHNCVMVLQSILIDSFSLVGIYFCIAGSIVKLLQWIQSRFICINSLDNHSMLSGPILVSNCRQFVFTVMTHSVQLGSRMSMNIWQRWIAHMIFTVISLSTAILNPILLSRWLFMFQNELVIIVTLVALLDQTFLWFLSWILFRSVDLFRVIIVASLLVLVVVLHLMASMFANQTHFSILWVPLFK